jgi:O-antigen/teichoic acid export membrane protein
VEEGLEQRRSSGEQLEGAQIMSSGTESAAASPPAGEPLSELRRSFLLRVGTAVGGLLSTFLTTIVAVRALPKADAAAFLGILAALMLGPMLGRFGLGQNVLRTLGAEHDLSVRRRSAGTHLRISLVFAAVTAPAVAVAATVALLGQASFWPVTLVTAALIVLETVRLMLSDVFASIGEVGLSVTATHHVRSIVVLPALVAVAVLMDRPTLTAMVITYLVAGLLPLLAVVPAARRAIDLLARPPHGAIRQALIAGTALFAVDGALFLVGRGDVWLANAVFAPTEAAHYATASTLAFQVMVLEGLASLAITPIAARMWAAGSRTELLRLLSSVATLATAATLIGILGMVVLGRWVLEVAYGPGFGDAYLLLVILALGGLGKAAFGLNITLLMALGRLRRAAWSAVIVLVVAVPAAVVAALLAGPSGLAIAATAAAVALSAAQWLAARPLVPAELGAPAPVASWRVLRAWREVRLVAPTP